MGELDSGKVFAYLNNLDIMYISWLFLLYFGFLGLTAHIQNISVLGAIN